MSILLMVFSLALMFQAGGSDEKQCTNYHGDAHPCHCGKAADCDGTPDDPEDSAKGVSKCIRGYCKKNLCRCVGPCETRARKPKKAA